MITKFGSLFARHVDLDNEGMDGLRLASVAARDPPRMSEGRTRRPWAFRYCTLVKVLRPGADVDAKRRRPMGATVFVTGKEHAVVQGSGWQTTPWEAAQQAAFQALHKGGILGPEIVLARGQAVAPASVRSDSCHGASRGPPARDVARDVTGS